ncbi:MAG: hypothetical protein VW876_10975, partial [Deltaproteobacteria bacterium]
KSWNFNKRQFRGSTQQKNCGQGCRENANALCTSRNDLALETDAVGFDLYLVSSVDGHSRYGRPFPI